MIHSNGHDALTDLANLFHNGNSSIVEKRTLAISNTFGQNYDQSGKSSNPFDAWNDGSIAVIPLEGIMLKSGSWFYYGVDEIAQILRLAYKSSKIAAILFKGNTPGGSTDSVYVLEEVLREKNKPTWMLVHGTMCSCGIYIASFCDKIWAINNMCTIGSLGVFARLISPTDQSGYKIEEIYPEESHLKNYPEREAIKGNTDPMKIELSKIANHFIGVVKENIPGITDKDVFAGKAYNAKEAASIGLINGVKSEKNVIAELSSLVENLPSTEAQNEIMNSFN